jgi:IstB-like ATP binding protein
MQPLTEIDDFERQVWQNASGNRQAALRTSLRRGHRLRRRSGRHPRLFQQLATGQWLKSYQNLIITGGCGTGKNLVGVRARPQRRARRVHGSLSTAAAAFRRPRARPAATTATRARSVACAGPVCRSSTIGGPEPMTAEQRRDLLEIVEDRYGRASTLLTSQLPVSRWHDVVGEPTLADTILDRIVHHAQASSSRARAAASAR